MRKLDYTRIDYLKDKPKLTQEEEKEMREIFIDFQTNQWTKIAEGEKRRLGMYIKSTNRLFNITDNYKTRKVSVGEVHYANLLLGHLGEGAFFHPVLILEVFDNRILVVPATTSKSMLPSGYHPKYNPKKGRLKDKGVYLVKKYEVGSKKDSVFLLNNSQMILHSRLLENSYMYTMNTNSFIFNDIKDTVYNICYPKKVHKIKKIQEEISIKNNKLRDLISLLAGKDKEIKHLKKQLEKRDKEIKFLKKF